jgi:hypothetical protein
MFKTLTFVAIFALCSLAALGQEGESKKISGFIEPQIELTDSGVTPQVNVSIERPLKGKVGTFAWILGSEHYSEAYVGLTYAPKPWLAVAGGAGFERDDKNMNARIGGYVWVGKRRVSNFLALEALGSGGWYKNDFNVQATKNLGIGVGAQRYNGIGPRAQWNIPKTSGKVQLRGYIYFGDHAPIAAAAVRIKF